MVCAENPSEEALPPPVWFLGIPIHPVSPSQLVRFAVKWAQEDKFRRIYGVNAHAMNLAHRHTDFRLYLQHADLVFCDGFGVKWMAKIVDLDIPYRMTPADWIDEFAAEVAEAGQSVFALGDEEGVAARFVELLASRHPGFCNAGSHHGFFEKTGRENDAVIELINRSGAEHLLVGFGMPLQERWIEANHHALRVKVAMAVGGLFRIYTGIEKRAPAWMSAHGLEWIPRLIRHPVRHFRRYVVGNPLLLARVLHARFTGRSGPP